MTITRTFTVAELEEIGFPFDLAEDVELEDTLIDKRRWYENRRMVIRHEGQAWAVPYASEYQDDSGVDWHHNARNGQVTATAVEQREVTVTKWLPVEAASVPPPLGDDPDEWPIATSRRGLIAAVRTWLGDIAPGLLADLEHSQVHDAPDGVVYDHLPYSVDELIDHLKGQQR